MSENIPLLRQGKEYLSLDTLSLQDHRSQQTVAVVSQANTGIISRDLAAYPQIWQELQDLSFADIFTIFKKAGELFLKAKLPMGEKLQGPEEFVQQQCATTALAQSLCRANMRKIHHVLCEIESILNILSCGVPLSILEQGQGEHGGRLVRYCSEAKSFAAVLPNNSPGVHTLWLPVLALKVPLALRPGTQDPWTPWRIYQALLAAGFPAQGLGFYPCDYSGAQQLLWQADKGMVFGSDTTVASWKNDPRISVHGAGRSKILLGEDIVEQWPDYLDLMLTSIANNSGRSCINASAIWTPKYGKEIAQALAEKISSIRPLALSDPQAQLAGFANREVAQAIDQLIEQGLQVPGASDETASYREQPRLVKVAGTSFLQPTIIYASDLTHPLADKEFLFPFASVLEVPNSQMLSQLPRTLIVTALTQKKSWQEQLLRSNKIDRLNIGPVPTWKIRQGEPHEGNLFNFLFSQRALQQS